MRCVLVVCYYDLINNHAQKRRIFREYRLKYGHRFDKHTTDPSAIPTSIVSKTTSNAQYVGVKETLSSMQLIG